MATIKRDYYEVLSITRTSNGEEIKRSFRRLAIKYHPDKNPGNQEAEERFKELGEAYDVLSDPEKRAAYDRYGHAAFENQGGGGGFGGHDPRDIFREVFGGGGGGIFEQFFGGGVDSSGRQKGADLRFDLQITLEEAATGVEKEIELNKLGSCKSCEGTGAQKGSKVKTCATCHGRGQVVSSRGFFQFAQTCPHCQGTGQVVDKPCRDCHGEGRSQQTSRIKLKIPAGIDSNVRLRSGGNGEAGIRGGVDGDLYVVVHVKEHPIFERDGMNLYCEVPLPFVTAALGGEIQVPTLDGKTSLKIPAGTQGGQVFKIRGRGMPAMQSVSRGDILTSVQVEVPTRLNAEQRKKLEEFAALCGEENSPLHKSFYERIKNLFS